MVRLRRGARVRRQTRESGASRKKNEACRVVGSRACCMVSHVVTRRRPLLYYAGFGGEVGLLGCGRNMQNT